MYVDALFNLPESPLAESPIDAIVADHPRIRVPHLKVRVDFGLSLADSKQLWRVLKTLNSSCKSVFHL